MKQTFREIGVLLTVALVVRVAFLFLVPEGSVSFDVTSWHLVAAELAHGENPYHTTTVLNWPPVWMQIIYWLAKASSTLGLSFLVVLQSFLILVEALLIVVLHRMMTLLFPGQSVKNIFLVAICLNPAAVFQVCQHGNFDILVGMAILSAVFFSLLYQRSQDTVDWLLSCACLGLAILLKTAPMILLPICFLGYARLPFKAKVLGAMLLFFPVALGVGTIYVLAPADVAQKVLAYRSAAGWFGISGILQQIPHWDQVLVPLYSRISSLLLMAFLAFMSWRAYFVARVASWDPLWLAILMQLAVIVFGPGYGPHYLGWFLPLFVLLYVADPEARRLLWKIFFVGALTYTLEYGLFHSHGSFLIGKDPSYFMESWGRNWSTQRGQTLVRLPLFFFYGKLFLMAARKTGAIFWAARS